MKNLLKLLPICLVLLGSCEVKDENFSNGEPSPEIQMIIDNGVTIDSIVLDYATIYTSNDGFPIIKPNPIDQFVNKNEVLVYFKLVSHSRDALDDYFTRTSEKLLKEEGIFIDYLMKYYDKLEDISIEVKKNNDEFYTINSNSDAIKFIPTPEINSGHTFAKYEMTIKEYIEINNSKIFPGFPDSFVLFFDDKNLIPNTYIFKIVFRFNNNKVFILHTDQIRF